MEIKLTYKYAMPIKHFTAQHYISPYDHDFDLGKRKPSFTLLYVVKGNVTFRTLKYSVTGGAGDFFYIPYGIRYNSLWQGENGTEHFCIHAVPFEAEGLCDDAFALQRIPELSRAEILDDIKSLYLSLKDGTLNVAEQGKMFFSLYATVLPYLKKERASAPSELLTRAVQYIQLNYKQPLSVPDMACALHVSESTLYHLFRKELGTTPIRYYNRVRLEQAISDFSLSLSIEDVAYRNGFDSYGYFRELFKEYTGMTPRQYRLKKQI